MNILQKFKKMLSTEIPEVVHNDKSSLYQRFGVKSKVEFDTAFANLCFAVMSARAKPFSKINNNILIQGREDVPLPQNHWLYTLFDGKPNPFYNLRQLKILTSLWLDLYGNAYLYTPLLNQKFPTQMYILPASFVKPKVNSDGFVGSYDVTVSGNITSIESKEICHLKTMKPDTKSYFNNFIIGQPLLLQASANVVGADKEIIEFVQSYFERETIPPFVLTSPDNMTDDQYSIFKAQWNTVMKDYPILGLLEGGMDVKPITSEKSASNIGSLDSIDKTILTRLASIWGVPAALLTNDFQNRATAEVTMQRFREDTIDSLVTDFEDSLTDHFRQWDSTIFFSHEFYTYKDPDTQFMNDLGLYKNGVINRNELRQKHGLKIIPDGDVFLIPSNLTTFDKLTTNPIPANPAKVLKYIGSNLKDVPEDVKKAFWIKTENLRHNHGKEIKLGTIKGFKEIQNKINRNIDSIKSVKNLKNLTEDINLPTLEEWESALEDNTKDPIKKQVIAILKESFNDAGGEFDEGAFKEKIAKMVKKSTAKIKMGASTASDEVLNLVKDIIHENPLASNSELLNNIKNSVNFKFDNIFTESRANLIAQTTSTFTTGIAQNAAWSDMGIGMSWLSVRDGKVRAAHAEADGQLQYSLSDSGFLVDGLDCEFPGDTGDAGNDIGCRCSMFPVESEVV